MTHRVQPYHLDDPLHWAVEQERQRHEDALWQLGELAMFCMLWNVHDYNQGMVSKCTTCNQSGRISAAYNQPGKNKCPDCFGTNFRGGYRAVIIRPVIITDGDQGNNIGPRGVSYPQSLTFESTTDFRIRAGDYIFRANGSRYQLSTATPTAMRSGFATPYNSTQGIGYHLNEGALEDQTSVAYIIPPQADDLAYILTNKIRIPEDKSMYEDIRGPLMLEDPSFPGARTNVRNLDKSLSGDPEDPYGTG